jgi:hypothetical protein
MAVQGTQTVYLSTFGRLQNNLLLNDRIDRGGHVFFAQPIVLCQVSGDLFDSIDNCPND